MQCKAIGIMGGTFDPIHYGHLAAAEQVRCELKLDEIIFIPVGDPPHKYKRLVTSAIDRLHMVRLATRDNPNFSVSDYEVNKTGPSYTVETLEQLKKDIGACSQLFFITGSDAVMQIATWMNYQHIFDLAKVVAVSRPGFELDSFYDKLPMLASFAQRLIFLEVPAIYIASTDIRDRVKDGRAIRYLLPPMVEEYIHQTGLYR